MKFVLLAFGLIAMSTFALPAHPAMSSRLTVAPFRADAAFTVGAPASSIPPLSLAPLPASTALPSSFNPTDASFAQLGATGPSLPLPSGLVLTLVALFVLALRIMGLNHARAMADHERDTYQGKARMFRSLHEGGADH